MWFIFWILAIVCGFLVRFVSESSGLSLFFISIVSGIVIFAYLIDNWREKKNFSSICYVLFFLLVFVFRGIVLSFYPDTSYKPDYINFDVLMLAMLYALSGLGFFLLGFHLKRNSITVERWGRYIFDRKFSISGLYLCSIIGVSSQFLQSLLCFSDSPIFSILNSIPSQIGYLGLFSTLILLFEREEIKKFRLIFCSLCLLIYLSGSLVMGMREPLIITFLMICSCLFLTKSVRDTLRNKYFLLLVIIIISLFAFLWPVMSVYKGYSGSSVISLSGKERIEGSIQLYKSIFSDKISIETSDMWISSFVGLSRRSGSALDFLSLLIARTPEVWNFQYGRTFLLGPLAIIPRALWHNKPRTNLGGKFYAEYLGYKQPYGRGGAGYTTIGDFWINFHVPGIVIGMFLFGIFVKIVQIFCVGSKFDRKRIAGIVFLIAITIVLVRQTRSISGIISSLVSMSALPLFFLLFIGKRKYRSKKSSKCAESSV